MFTTLHAVSRLSLAAGIAISLTALAGPDARTGAPLGGPAVETEATPGSLVERNLDGSMRRPDVPPAEAALELIDLDEQTRAEIEVYLAERAALIDSIVIDNMETLNELRGARQAGEAGSRGEHAETIRRLFEPVLKDGPLDRRIAGMLPESQRRAYLDLVAEHDRAHFAEWVRERRKSGEFDRPGGPRGFGGPDSDDAQRRPGGPGFFGGPGMGGPGMFGDPGFLDEPNPEDEALLFGDEEPPFCADGPGLGLGMGPGGPHGDGPPPRGPGDRMAHRFGHMQALHLEVRRSMERVTGDRKDRFERLVEELDLTPEQQEKVRAIFTEAREQRAAGGEPGPRERMERMRRIASVLSPEQRAKLRELAGPRGPRGQADAPGPGRGPGPRPDVD